MTEGGIGWLEMGVPARRGTETNLKEGEHLALFLPVEQAVMVLHRDERGEVVRDRIVYPSCSVTRI